MVHVIGVVVFSLLGGSALVSSARLQGDSSAIELQSWQSHRPQVAAEFAVTEPLKVEVMPREARVARRRYYNTSITSAPPTANELATVQRLTDSLPPPRIVRSSQATDSQVAMANPRQVASVLGRRKTVAMPRVRGTLATSKVRLLKSRPPNYPSRAELQGLEGRVLLQAHITADGLVEKIEIITSSGHPILDAAAVRAVRTWQFSPSQCEGIPIPSTERIPVRFTLK
jgi:TonB family protein